MEVLLIGLPPGKCYNKIVVIGLAFTLVYLLAMKTNHAKQRQRSLLISLVGWPGAARVYRAEIFAHSRTHTLLNI